ncbi:phage tail tube protein [Salmonella enterica]|uniref:phage tail tube protein n=1 Tax=Salmonella enterica TaxID=28901 RepID=UPI0002413C3C|nr:phage tail tube protein [Salmonella enterica]EHL43168.1 phage tail tube protein [Salmonella enterica subsp. enterica serovar Montevideo str. ATCC BAA710]
MGKIAGTTYFKIDGQQLSVTGGIEVPMNTKVRDDVIGLDGSVDYKETSRAPYTKVTAKVPKNFPIDKITSSDVMTITSELAKWSGVCSLKRLAARRSQTINPEEGTVDLEFHGEEDFTSDKRTCAQKSRINGA